MSSHLTRAALALVSVVSFLGASTASAVGVGDTPRFAVKTLEGKPLRLEDYKGKIVLVDFWATWCGPCMAEAPHMVAVNQKYKDKGLQIIGISLDRDGLLPQKVAKEKGFTWPQSLDVGSKLAKAWGVNGIPAVFLLDPSGKVVWTGHPGAMDAQLEKAFRTTPPQLADEGAVAEVRAALDEVSRTATSDTAAALKKLSQVPAAARKDAKIAKEIASIETKLQGAAEALVADADVLLEQKRFGEAAAALKVVSGALAKSPVGARAGRKLAELEKMPEVRTELEARDALSAAQDQQANEKHEEAYVAFKSVARKWPATDAAKVATEAVAQYDAKDPEFGGRALEKVAGGKAKSLMGLAQSYRTAGKADLARKKYQEVIDLFPDTNQAEIAKKELASLK